MTRAQTNKEYAPWSVEQVSNLKFRQQSKMLHPYTCRIHKDTALIPTFVGFICDIDLCDYVQTWCWDFDANTRSWWHPVDYPACVERGCEYHPYVP